MLKVSFTEADIRRAMKGAVAAGITVSRVEIDPKGKVVIFTDSKNCKEDLTPLERRRERRGAG